MNEEILNILSLFLTGDALTEEQERSLQEWREASLYNEEAMQSLQDDQFLQHSVQEWESFAESEEAVWHQLSGVLFKDHPAQPVYRKIHILRKWWWAAASTILLLGAGAYLWFNNKKSTDPQIVKMDTGDIQPGKSGAVLTLADGSSLILDSLHNGIIARQDGSLAEMKNGELRYDVKGATTGEVKYNIMSTPKGRQFNLSLPDGTRVWLNAASSIRYPTFFTGKERRVEITGEAYLEVAKNTQVPFRVSVNDMMDIVVLGTHFNVNAYEASIHSTLLEGSIRVRTLNAGIASVATLKPGQQARTGSNGTAGSITILDQVNLERVIAWKNGYFNFEGLRFEEIMNQLERWYDIDVVFEKGIPQRRIWGEMTKDVPLSGVLKYFQGMGIRFRLEGRKLIISE